MAACTNDDKRLEPVSEVKLRLLDREERGLIGFASCILHGEYYMNNISVRRGTDGGLFLAYPAGKSCGGALHHHWNPITRSAAKAMDRAILGRLGELGRV